MPKVIIDGTEYSVKPGRNMLEAALDHGLNLPYFCWHPAMGSVGACRLCAVKVYKDEHDTKGRIQMACMTPACEGTRISINDPEAAEFRRYVIEWLMTNHPHDCPVCDEGGECHLQDMTTMCGQVYRRFEYKKRTYRNQNLGPLVNHEMNRCIQCYRCVRFYKDLAGGEDFGVFGSKNHLYFGRHEDGVLESEFSGNLVEVCPTGVFTDKTYKRHYARKWDLECAPSVCVHCGLGCNIIPGARHGKLRRVTARFNSEVNGYFICDRGRYGYGFANSELRLRKPASGRAEGRETVSWDAALDRAKVLISEGRGVIGIGSPRASLEANHALKKLVGDSNFSTGLSERDQECAELALKMLREGPARTPSLAEVEHADVVLVLGADPTNEAPMLDFAIRQAMRKAPLDVARKLKIPDWDAKAVATALNGAKGKLYIAAPWRTKLAKIAAESVVVSMPEVAALAESLAAPDASGQLAADLREARQPLVVTSISAGADVLRAAANVTRELKQVGKDCWLLIIVPEANTMCVAMLGGMSVDAALAKLGSEADTLVVLENYLTRRVDPKLYESAIANAKQIIALDCVSTDITERADIVLPTQACFESNGTFVNNEGRAQRFFQAFIPPGEPRPAWRCLGGLLPRAASEMPPNDRDLGCFGGLLPKPASEMPPNDGGLGCPGGLLPRAASELPPNDSGLLPKPGPRDAHSLRFDDILREVASLPGFAGVLDAAPLSDWRSAAGRKVPRMSHRYAGRTSESAAVDVKEESRPADPDSPFAFSMEGDQNPVPAPLVPRFWYPGWNSVNSTAKFQIEVGGPLHGGPSGARLIEPSGADGKPLAGPRAEALGNGQVWLIPRLSIFGSDELSALAPAISELIPEAAVRIHSSLAAKLGLADGGEARIEIAGRVVRLTARIDDTVAEDAAVVPANFTETLGILGLTACTIARGK